jgi:PBP1b-binding outer membrane lipoprotein LpoB
VTEVEKKLQDTLFSKHNFSYEIEKVAHDFNKNLCGVDNHGFIKYSPLDNIDVNTLNLIQEEIEKNFKLLNTINKTLGNQTLHSDTIIFCDTCNKAFKITSAKKKALTQGLEDFIDKIAPEHIQRLHERLTISPCNLTPE